MIEKRQRSILKAMSWRLTGTMDTIIVSWILTGTLRLALSIGMVEVFTKMALYYFHERAWNKIKFGLEEPDYQI